MIVQGEYVKARHYIETHTNPLPDRKYEIYPCITISRETGSGDEIISEKLLNYFSKYNQPGLPEWTFFDKNLINKVLEEHHLPFHLQKLLSEEKHSAVNSIFVELLTGEPSAMTLINKEIRTIHHLCRTGNVIIIGRGANFISAKMQNAFHVRLIAPIEQRIIHIQELLGIGRKEAELFVKKDDAAKKSFAFSQFRQNIENPIFYHLVINTGIVSYAEAAKMIERAVMKRAKKKIKMVKQVG
jgi:cytidylate kinase